MPTTINSESPGFVQGKNTCRLLLRGGVICYARGFHHALNVHKMDIHRHNLSELCRVGGRRFKNIAKKSRDTKYVVSEHKDELKYCFKLNVEHDNADIHPPNFCVQCMAVVRRSVRAREVNREFESCGGGCGKEVVEWESHQDDCMVCSGSVVAQGRTYGAAKKRKFSQQSRSTHTSVHSNDCTSTRCSSELHERESVATGIDMGKDEFFACAMPSFKAEDGLSPSRALVKFECLVCSICLHICDQAVELSCCQSLVCAPCIWHWLENHNTCPKCRQSLHLSQCAAPHRIACEVLSNLQVRCEIFSENTLEGCSVCVQLHQLQEHYRSCTYNPDVASAPQPRVVSGSTTVSEVLTSSPSKFKGQTTDKLLSKLIATKQTDDTLLQHTAGPTVYWLRRRIFASTRKLDDTDMETLGSTITEFMLAVRQDIVLRHNRYVTPKLHLLESHLLPALKHFNISLELLGEQGGEAIHHRFNELLGKNYVSIKPTSEQLRLTVKHHVDSTVPSRQLLKPTPQKK